MGVHSPRYGQRRAGRGQTPKGAKARARFSASLERVSVLVEALLDQADTESALAVARELERLLGEARGLARQAAERRQLCRRLEPSAFQQQADDDSKKQGIQHRVPPFQELNLAAHEVPRRSPT